MVAYFLFVFLVCMGVIQLSAARSKLKGLLIFPWVYSGYLIGAALPAGALLWYSLSGRIIKPGDLAGVEGAEQFLLFMAAAGCATVFTAIIASIIQRGRPLAGAPPLGMEGLRNATLLQLLQARFGVRKGTSQPPR